MGLPRDFSAPLWADGYDAVSAQGAGSVAAALRASDGKEKIAQLLGESVNLLLIVGLQLASVRCRMEEEQEQMAIESVSGQLDAALVQIRHLAVRLTQRGGNELPEWMATVNPQ